MRRSNQAHAQTDSLNSHANWWWRYAADTSLTYAEITRTCDSIFALDMPDDEESLLPDTSTEDDGDEENGARMNYYRWKQFWLFRLDATTGKLHRFGEGVAEKFIEGTNNFSDCAGESPLQQAIGNGAGWRYLGPDESGNTYSDVQHKGRVTQIVANPDDPGEVYMSDEWGGLWHTLGADSTGAGCPHWECLTDYDPQVSGIGVTNFAVDFSTSPHTIYLSLGYWGYVGFVSLGGTRTVGLFCSQDGGHTYQHLTPMEGTSSTEIPIGFPDDYVGDLKLYPGNTSTSKFLFFTTYYKTIRLDISSVASATGHDIELPGAVLMDYEVLIPSTLPGNHGDRFKGMYGINFLPTDPSTMYVCTNSNIGWTYSYSAHLYQIDDCSTCDPSTATCYTDITSTIAGAVEPNVVPDGGFEYTGTSGTATPFDFNWRRNKVGPAYQWSFAPITGGHDMEYKPSVASTDGCLEVPITGSFTGQDYDIEYNGTIQPHTTIDVYLIVTGDSPEGECTSEATGTTSYHIASYDGDVASTFSGPGTISCSTYVDRLKFVASYSGSIGTAITKATLDNVSVSTTNVDYIRLSKSLGSNLIVDLERYLGGQETPSSFSIAMRDNSTGSWSASNFITDVWGAASPSYSICQSTIDPDLVYLGDAQGGLITVDFNTAPAAVNSLGSTNFYHIDIRALNLINTSSTTENLFFGNDGGISLCQDCEPGTSDLYRCLNGNSFNCQLSWAIGSSLYRDDLSLAALDNSHLDAHSSSLNRWVYPTTFGETGDGADVTFGKRYETQNLRLYARSSSGPPITMRSTVLPGIPALAVTTDDLNINGLPMSRIKTTLGGEFVIRNNSCTTTVGTTTTTTNRSDILNLHLSEPPAPYTGTWQSITSNVDPSTIPTCASVENNSGWVDSKPFQCIAPDMYDANYVAAYANNEGSYPLSTSGGYFMTTIDGGVHWNQHNVDLDNPPYRYVSDMCTDPRTHEDDKRVWAACAWYESPGFNRVFVSTNNCDTWQAYSEGLPAGPVHVIVYDEQSHYLFAGTDEGIYCRYADGGLDSIWNCYSLHFPNAFVTDLDINYCTRKIYAATHGRGGWVADLPPARTYTDGTGTDDFDVTEISSNTTWGDSKDLITDVVIHKDATLTINNSAVIGMASGRRIIVERGAKLIVDGATITNACGDMWEGIQAQGTYWLPQNEDNCGYVTITNGATIENAHVGAGNYIYANEATGDDWGNHGGVIRADNSSFINCRVGVSLQPFENKNAAGYPLNDKSYFNLVSFTVGNDFKGSEGNFPFLSFVLLNSVQGVYFNGCTFSNDATELVPDLEYHGQGITSWNSRFYVLPFCNEPEYIPCEDETGSSFNGLYEGILSGSGDDAFSTFYVDKTDFRNCAIGIHSLAGNHFVAVNSTFEIGGGLTV